MSLISTRVVALTVALLLVSCGTAPVVFDRTNLASVKHMAILTPGFPDQPTVAVLPPTYGALFLIINSIQESNRSSEFAGFLARAQINPEVEFSKSLVSCLHDAGVQPLPLPVDPRRKTLLKEYSSVATQGADAVLDVVVTRYGYYAVTNAAPFKPNIVMQARLVDAHSRAVLMQDTIDMVNVPPADPTVTTFSFQDYSDIAANPDGAVRALRSAIASAASTVCKRLT